VLHIVKEGRRHRYIGFIIKQSSGNVYIDKSEMINEIREQCRHVFNKDCNEMNLRLIRFDGTKGILKCSHTEKENAIKLLKSIKKISSKKVEIETVGTSGTIKALIKKHMII
jgi:ribonuclease P/MRP protein subunit POP5